MPPAGGRRRRAGADSRRAVAAALRAHGAGEHRRERPLLPGIARHPLFRTGSRGGLRMKAVQLPKYDAAPELVDVPDPAITGPLDVIVRIGGAGVCRTDLHIIEGQWAEKSGV